MTETDMTEAIPLRRKNEIVEVPGFGVGTRVQLKTSPMEMIVREAVRASDNKTMVRCDWQLGDGTAQCADYWPEQLWRIERFEVGSV
jgi:uncharacterized protein YodC (DUF2158 family)